MVQLVFDRDMILPIKHWADWVLICQKNHEENNNYNIRKSIKRLFYDYKVGDNVVLNNNLCANTRHHILYRI